MLSAATVYLTNVDVTTSISTKRFFRQAVALNFYLNVNVFVETL